MRKTILTAALLCAFLGTQAQEYYEKHVAFPAGATTEQKIDMASRLVPTPQQLAWQQMEFTCFLHFGINTFTGREWGDGKEDPAIFNPTELDCEQWVRALKEGGFKMAIITAKHHDGFCLWPTRTTKHSVASSPWKNGKGDVVQELRKACSETGTILILDEIQSGYGRSGKFFAHQYNDIKPDLITVAKGIGNGFPMAGVLISPMFKPVYGQLGTTFGGNHLACSAALAVMDVIEQENLIENAKVVGNYLLEELKKFPQIKEVRGRGLMIGLEFEELIKELRSRLIYDEHVFTGASGTNVLRLLPPLCLSMEEAEDFLARFKKVL